MPLAQSATDRSLCDQSVAFGELRRLRLLAKLRQAGERDRAPSLQFLTVDPAGRVVPVRLGEHHQLGEVIG